MVVHSHGKSVAPMISGIKEELNGWAPLLFHFADLHVLRHGHVKTLGGEECKEIIGDLNGNVVFELETRVLDTVNAAIKIVKPNQLIAVRVCEQELSGLNKHILHFSRFELGKDVDLCWLVEECVFDIGTFIF